MYGPIRNALENDLKLLEEQEALIGRETLVATARMIASNCDISPTPSLWAKFLDCLNGLGIGKVEKYEEADAFDEFLDSLDAEDYDNG